jgi:hypothetical protein
MYNWHNIISYENVVEKELQEGGKQTKQDENKQNNATIPPWQ